MQQDFPGYFAPSPAEYEELWHSGLIVLDTNSLLNLYRYSSPTRAQFFDVLESVAGRLWIPHQVGFEFLERRFDVIADQEDAYGQLREALENSRKTLESVANQYRRHPALDIPDLLRRVSTHFDALREELTERESAHPLSLAMAREADAIADKITALFEGKVGPAFADAELKAVYSEGANRYAAKIPPGYRDASKGEPGKYGDLVLWKQLLSHGAEVGLTTIFVTDDGKEDWWRQFRGKKIGPRPELVQEYGQATGKRLHMYSPEQFLRESEQRLGGVGVSPETLGEVERVSTVDPERARVIIERRLRELQERHARLRRLSDYRSDPTADSGRVARAEQRKLTAAREVQNLERLFHTIPESELHLLGPQLQVSLNDARQRLMEADRHLAYANRRGNDNPFPAQLLELEAEIAEAEAALAADGGAAGAS